MSVQKRKRSANWTASEKRLLIDLVTDHFSVIENKKTDGVSMKEKLSEWVVISNEYNSQTSVTHRTADNLKAQWESMKKSAKKEAATDRMEILKTGGGLPKEKKEDPMTSRILSLIKISAVGLNNPFDNDMIIEVVPTSIIDTQETAPGLAERNVIESVPEWKTGDDELSPNTQSADLAMDWADYTPKKLRTPMSTQLRGPVEENQTLQSASLKKWSSRRRPHPAAATMGRLEEKKVEAIEMQMKHASEEREEAKRLHNIQMQIQGELLKQNKMKTRAMLLKLRLQKKKKQ